MVQTILRLPARSASLVRRGCRQAERCLDVVILDDTLNPADRPREGAHRIVGQPVAQQEQKNRLTIRRALARIIKIRSDHCFQLTADLFVLANLTVMHEQPVAVGEGMTITALDWANGGGAHMGEEQRCFDLPRNTDQVLVVPCRQDITKDARLLVLTLPTKAAPVRICRRDRVTRAEALIDQRVFRQQHKGLGINRRPGIGYPTAHGRRLRAGEPPRNPNFADVRQPRAAASAEAAPASIRRMSF